MRERKKDWIADALSELDDQYIEEAVDYVKPKKNYKFIKPLSVLAACLLLFVGAGAAVSVRMGMGGNKAASTETSAGVTQDKENEMAAAPAAPAETMAEAAEEAGSAEAVPDAAEDIFSEMESHLKQYPDVFEDINSYELYVSAHGSVTCGQKYWDDFYQLVESDADAHVDIMEYTVEGDPIVTCIEYKDDTFYIVVDSSRDTFGGDVKYTSYQYAYWKVLEETLENGDVLRTVHFATVPLDAFNSVEEITEYVRNQPENSGVEIKTILYVTIDNVHAHVEENIAWHELATSFDESEILIQESTVDSIVVINGENGERKTISSTLEKETFDDLLKMYHQLDVAPSEVLDSRSGYRYKMELYDAQGKLLQTVIPYIDAVQLNWSIYDGTYNGTTIMLLMKLRDCF